LIAKAVAAYGRLDILVNNAGISGSSLGYSDGLEGWHRIIAVNQTSVFLGTKLAAEQMAKTGGGSIDRQHQRLQKRRYPSLVPRRALPSRVGAASLFRHPSLAQTSEIGGFKQGVDPRDAPISVGLHLRDARKRTFAQPLAGLGTICLAVGAFAAIAH
jgi:NAD(P)-dependent dehydrogenase (short-subunit alcohol dehydrogenase family)